MFQRSLFGPLLQVISDLYVTFIAKPLDLKKKEETYEDSRKTPPAQRLIWLNIFSIGLLHLAAAYYLLSFILFDAPPMSVVIWAYFYGVLGGLGVTAGAHRLWAHNSYKATLPFKLFLLFCFTSAGQNSVFDWVRDHRVHHRYTETDADPHNAKRGFFFSHVGWLMMTKHPDVYEKGRNIDLSDIKNDPILEFQRKYFVPLKILIAFVIPTAVPPLAWGAPWQMTFISLCIQKYVFTLNATWLVNSAAHIWGNHPFDKRMNAAENVSVSIMSLGEGWHNYHHVFPWDYKAAELGPYSTNFTTMVIDFAAKLGLVYDLKQPSKTLIEKVATKYGDGSWTGHKYPEESVEKFEM